MKLNFNTTFVEKLSGLTNHFERAMITFLDHQNCREVATLFYHADTLPHWRKRKNLRQISAAVDEASVKQLATLISGYYHYTEGRGKNCIVEPCRRGDLDYFFAYPEDYSQHSIEWVDGQFDCRRNPDQIIPLLNRVLVINQQMNNQSRPVSIGLDCGTNLTQFWHKSLRRMNSLPTSAHRIADNSDSMFLLS